VTLHTKKNKIQNFPIKKRIKTTRIFSTLEV